MLIGSTLGRYLSTQLPAGRSSLVFGTVFALVYTLDFVELMRRAGDAEGATPALMAQLALFRTPAVAEQIFPFAVLFGRMAALLQLSRKLELVVARAAGISAWQFLQPGMLVALAIGAALGRGLQPALGLPEAEGDRDRGAASSPRTLKLASSKDLWIRQKSLDGQAIIRAETAVERTTTLARVTRLHLRRSRAPSRSASRPPRRRSGTATGS